MVERIIPSSSSSSSSATRARPQPIAIRHVLATRRPWLRNELTGSLENLRGNASRRGSGVSLEQEMDSSVENLFRDLDDRDSKEPPSRRRDRSSRSATLERNQPSRSAGSSGSNDDFSRLDSTKRSLYVDCSETGARKFRMDFGAEGFEAGDISVTVHPGSRLEIRGVREDTDGGRRTTNEFSRRIRLPGDVDVRGLSCSLVDGGVVVEAPLLLQPQSKPVSAQQRPHSSSWPSSRVEAGRNGGLKSPAVMGVGPSSPTAISPLNVPVVRVQSGVNVLSLCVEVGRLFRSDDVTVKVRNPTKVVVSAERSEETDCSRMTASLVREFDLPARIAATSLKAGLTEQGLLRITAHLLPDEVQ